ncbi:hypothetical protein BO82DRAFT_428162 [Aspergillus uvarum CBS 121591]|uniref:Uncharacterized protein n=1 Tax=Aspergillus uvarum CBS 121591 TaxID=1448315 RepID=A0A319CWD8_9EURO|nr:hypothetical protein BO82DRAFT_428162 [Aspergillus uvarum CBS 121591]PYH86807.1 hypothetical protein BO82DRAFT_428162 [Aspergillus uvarum CBS 121591]
MSGSTEKQVAYTEQQQEKRKLSITEVQLFGKEEHTHGAPIEDLDHPSLDLLHQLAKGQTEVVFFTDGHHLVQISRPEDLARCGDTETTGDMPEEQANAYHAKFARRVGCYWRLTCGYRVRQSSNICNARKEKPLSFYFGEDAFMFLVAPFRGPLSRASGR